LYRRAPAVAEADPTILTGPHEAEPGARAVTEFRLPQMVAMGQQGGRQGVAVKRRYSHAVDGDGDDFPIRLGNPEKLPVRRPGHGLHSPRYS
jgi:hypothetical protein